MVYAAEFVDDTQGEFDLGTYLNTEWNGSSVVLSGENLTGNFTSQRSFRKKGDLM
mgnify:CR=1 FL=1